MAARKSVETGLPTVAYTNNSNDSVVAYPTGAVYGHFGESVAIISLFAGQEATSLYSNRKVGESACIKIVPDVCKQAGYEGLPYLGSRASLSESVCFKRCS